MERPTFDSATLAVAVVDVVGAVGVDGMVGI